MDHVVYLDAQAKELENLLSGEQDYDHPRRANMESLPCWQRAALGAASTMVSPSPLMAGLAWFNCM